MINKSIGSYVERKTMKETKTSKGIIAYSKTGTHIYPKDNEPEGVSGLVVKCDQRDYLLGVNENELAQIELIQGAEESGSEAS